MIMSSVSVKIPLKDQLFHKQKVIKIAHEIAAVDCTFDQQHFVAEVVDRFPQLELKERITWITICLEKYLPKEYRRAVNILIQSLPAPNDPTLSDNDFGDFIYAPYAEFIAKHGCLTPDLHFSLQALKEITMRFSAEDAIRYFINAFPRETLSELLVWSKDSNYHVRRLCSEGTRPKLPWAQKIHIDISEPIAILDNLYADHTRFVTRSVANHINDISKIDSQLSINTLKRWRDSKKQTQQEMDYITRHALRTLIKRGDQAAFSLLGISTASCELLQFLVPQKVKMNSELVFHITVLAQERMDAIIDYVISFQSKRGTMSNKKVFKLKKITLYPDEQVTLTKRHMMKQHMTTRTLYHGKQTIEIQINGVLCGKKEFELVV